MTNQQIKNLANRLCIKDNCSGFLRESVDSKKNEILRCTECHHYLYLNEVDMLLINYEVDKIHEHSDDETLKYLNNFNHEKTTITSDLDLSLYE